MTKRAYQPTVVDVLMAEHIQLPGCPQIIVTRGWAYTFLRDELGYSPKARGFGSIDYMVFGREETNEPLTDLTIPECQSVFALMKEHAA